MAVSLMAVLAIFAWTSRLLNPTAGLIACFFCALSPTVLAHGHLMTSDLTAAVLFLMSAGCFWMLLRELTWWRLVASAVCFGLLMVSKMSGALFVLVALLMFVSGRALGAVFGWLMGSLADASWIGLGFAAPLMLVSLVLLLVRWRRLNVLLLGDAHAASLGVNVEREKLVLTMLATLATSAAVAISGTIGFVGLVVPHLLRLLIGPDHRLLLPASMLCGASLLVAADLGARLVPGGGRINLTLRRVTRPS